jgi:uncharacterized membrane protein YkoI
MAGAVLGAGFALATAAALCAERPRPQAALFRPSADEETLSDSAGANRDRIIAAIQKQFNARVVRVDEIQVNGRRIYEMRLLSDQKVWNVRVDAETGQVLGSD